MEYNIKCFICSEDWEEKCYASSLENCIQFNNSQISVFKKVKPGNNDESPSCQVFFFFFFYIHHW